MDSFCFKTFRKTGSCFQNILNEHPWRSLRRRPEEGAFFQTFWKQLPFFKIFNPYFQNQHHPNFRISIIWAGTQDTSSILHFVINLWLQKMMSPELYARTRLPWTHSRFWAFVCCRDISLGQNWVRSILDIDLSLTRPSSTFILAISFLETNIWYFVVRRFVLYICCFCWFVLDIVVY